MKGRPNFLLVMTDQHRADHLGCYGNPVVRTPTIDALAARGRRFDRCYVANPNCMPNRAALLTARVPSVNGVRHNGVPLPLEAVTFVELLRAAGYRTGLVGKSHLQNQSLRVVEDGRLLPPPLAGGTPPPPELEQAVRPWNLGARYEVERLDLWARDPDRPVPSPYYGFEHVRFANGHGDQVLGHYQNWLASRTPDAAALRGAAHALPAPGVTAPQAWRTRMPEELYPTTYVADATIDFLEEHARAHAGRPFFAWCSFPDPHHPFTPPGRYWDLYDPADVPLPASAGHVDAREPALLRRLRAAYASGELRPDKFLAFVAAEPELRQIAALTYGMVTMVDDALGRILRRLAELGLAEDTVVIFTSDHGDLMGDRSLVLKQGFHYHGLIRVPLIWSDPARPGGAASDALVGTLDIGTSILARAGLQPAYGMQGIDAVGRDERGLRGRDALVIEEDDLGIHMGTLGPVRLWTLVDERWRLTFWHGDPQGELYDLRDDPGELRNRWGDPACEPTRLELVERLARERMALTDVLPFAQRSA